MPGLAGALRQAATGSPIAYQLDGTVGVDAGRLGTPTFGPMLLTRGDLRIESGNERYTVTVHLPGANLRCRR